MRTSRSSSNASSTSTPSSASSDNFQIFVKLLSGDTIPLTVPSDTTISTLRQLLSLRTSAPTTDIRLVHAGKHLTSADASSGTSTTPISDLLPPSSTLHMALPIRGGMPTKKIKCTFKDCKDGAQRIVGDCSFCQGHFCGKHRMLEDHKCSGLEDCKKESHERNADTLNTQRTVAVKGI
ncbi:hypothetical protein HO133_004616 [Letharia lupina]|uniref:AN1-type zinc finger protein n=1 Tax=Letharia lupina TaxID=560253 RepID=A0A8H6FKM5_9LECA|nr:uncharacterized protein HO133_004616 [Letharia lupina]KAF6230276.1 hypothetical protein HO133_004616 [Letharia lupina]